MSPARSMPPLPPGSRMPPALQGVAWVTRPVPWLHRLHARHGDVFTIHIAGETPWVMLADPHAIREVFRGKPADLLAGEGNAILGPLLGARSLLLLDGEEHLRERKLLLPPFHGEKMVAYAGLMREVADAEVARWPVDTPLAAAPRMQAVTLEIIVQAVFGVREGALLDRLRSALVELLDLLALPSTFAVVAAIGPRRALRLPKPRRIMAAVDAVLAETIAERRAATDLAERDDILSLLLQARREDGSPMTDTELRDELMTLLVAGHETTATALGWALERLTRTPDVLATLRERLADGDRDYLQATAREALRLRPVLPVVLRQLARPMTIAGVDLPEGVKVAPSITLVHRDPRIYEDPLAFRPERFLDQAPGTYTWLPFGGGVRRCIGAAFAMMELETVLEAIVTARDVRPVRPRFESVVRRAITLAPSDGATITA